MSQACPISFQRVDENCVRLIATQISIVALLFIITLHPLFLTLLLTDFLMRLMRLHHLSPFIFVAMRIINGFKIEPKPTDEKPKRFALYLGVLTTLLMVLFTFLGFTKVVMFLTTFLMLASFLEAYRSYCIGCKVYQALQTLKFTKER